MKFQPLSIPGAFCIEIEKKEDERGFFARSFCENEFLKNNLVATFPQCNLSFNMKKGTLRGMHYSVAPSAEIKLVRCVRGKAYDVLVDLRRGSQMYLKWLAIEISSENRKMLYIPEGVAHGFQTLEDDTELFYHMSNVYDAACARGVRWDDPSLSIHWPILNPIMSPKDREYTSMQ